MTSLRGYGKMRWRFREVKMEIASRDGGRKGDVVIVARIECLYSRSRDK